MSIFSKDDDERYDEYLREGSTWGKMDRSEWQQKQNRADEIASGFSSELFERDEDVLERVKELKDKG